MKRHQETRRPGLIRTLLADFAGCVAIFAMPVALFYIAHGFGL